MVRFTLAAVLNPFRDLVGTSPEQLLSVGIGLLLVSVALLAAGVLQAQLGQQMGFAVRVVFVGSIVGMSLQALSNPDLRAAYRITATAIVLLLPAAATTAAARELVTDP